MEPTSSYTLTYPSSSGFGKTDIRFFGSEPDIASCYETGQDGPMRLFVTDTTIASLDATRQFISLFQKESDRTYTRQDGKDVLLVIDSGEAYKDIDHVLQIVRAALVHDFDRGCVFVGIGGGVICDMTAFAASMFKRGVAVEFVPTTLLAMVDAAVGGKTGCDFESYKNMIGAFYPARTLNVWPSFVQTLPQKEYVSGLAEAIKTALLFSPQMVRTFREQYRPILDRAPQVLHQIITECVKAKAAVVEEDFKEHGKRAFLNLGHTFGHALESVAGLGAITHGEAVAWGMGRAADLAKEKGLCTEQFATATKELLSAYGYDMSRIPALILTDGCGQEEAAAKIVGAMRKDKKNKASGALRVILQTGEAQTVITEISGQDALRVLV